MSEEPALALKNPPHPSGGLQGERGKTSVLPGVLCWQELQPPRMIYPHQACRSRYTQQLRLENDDGVRFKSLEDGLLFLSALIKVRAFDFPV